MRHDDLQPLQSPELMPAVRTAADLERHWRALMGPLGFSEHILWMMFLDAAGRAAPVLSQINELPPRPDEDLLRSLMHVANRLCNDIGVGTVAFLLSHPGSRGPTASDREWAWRLTSAAQEAGVSMWPVHMADDSVLRPLAPDDLIRAG